MLQNTKPFILLLVCIVGLAAISQVVGQTLQFDRRQILNGIAAVKEGRKSNRQLIADIKRDGVSFQLTPENEELLRDEGATNELIEAIRDISSSESKPAVPKPVAPKQYAAMSEAEKFRFVETNANKLLDVFGRVDGDEISPAGFKMIKAFVDGYSMRTKLVRVKELNQWGANLEVLLRRGARYSPTIRRAFSKNDLQPEIGIYLAMIESEFQSCIQSPTGPLGMFQLTFTTADNAGIEPTKGASPTNPDTRCYPSAAAQATASNLSSLMNQPGREFLTNDAIGIPLLIGAYNSGEGGLAINIAKVKETKPEFSITVWNLLENAELLSAQYRSENYKYVPKFFAAAIVGENPSSFGISNMEPLSTETSELNVSVRFIAEQLNMSLEPRSGPVGERPKGLIVPGELYGDGIVKQKAKINEMLQDGYMQPMDFFDLAEKRSKQEFIELPMATDAYVLDVGGAASNEEFREFSVENGSSVPRNSSEKYKKMEQLAGDFGGQRYDLKSPQDRRQIRVRLLRMLNPRSKAILEEIAWKYYGKFGRPLRITSLTRSIDYQIQLSKDSRIEYQLPANLKASGIGTPPHSSGCSFDISRKNMSADEQNFMAKLIADLENKGRGDALIIHGGDPAFHVFVFNDGLPPKSLSDQ